MTHPIRTSPSHLPAASASARPSYPCCSLENRGRTHRSLGPTWEELLGQR